MSKIKYVTLSGQEHVVSDDFICFGMSALWRAMESAEGSQKSLLEEAHSIMSGVLYGTVTKVNIEIMHDRDDHGESITIYDSGKCVGTFLSDDPIIKEYEKKGGEHVDGLDNRTK